MNQGSMWRESSFRKFLRARVVQFFTITGTQLRPFGGLGATGRRFQVTGVSVSTLNDSGRITHERRVYDVTSMLVQLGALRAKPYDESSPVRPQQQTT